MIRPLRVSSRPIASHVLTKRTSLGGEETELGDQQDAGVEDGLAEGAGQRALLFVPGLGEDALAQPSRLRLPVLGALGDMEPPRDPAEPVASRPAQHRGIRMGARAGAIFPQASIGFERQRERALAQRLEQSIKRFVSHLGQALVEEHLRRGEHDAAVDVVLGLQGRLVADPNRPVSEKALQVWRDRFLHRRKRHDAMDRLNFAGVGGDGRDVVDIGFHRLGFAQPVERVDDEIGVPQPAITIVPVSDRRRRLGDRGRVRGDDRAGLLEAAEPQRDCGAHDRRLPFERHGQVARPLEPTVARAVEEFPARRVDGAQEGLILPEDQVDRTRKRERDLADDVGERRIGGQPKHLGPADVTDVIGADDHIRRRMCRNCGSA